MIRVTYSKSHSDSVKKEIIARNECEVIWLDQYKG